MRTKLTLGREISQGRKGKKNKRKRPDAQKEEANKRVGEVAGFREKNAPVRVFYKSAPRSISSGEKGNGCIAEARGNI